MIRMTFSCDGAHYIDHKTFFEKLETFATTTHKDAFIDERCGISRGTPINSLIVIPAHAGIPSSTAGMPVPPA